MEKSTKIILAILLLLCLLEMPYGFYQFVRFIAMVGFAYLGYTVKVEKPVKLTTAFQCKLTTSFAVN